MYLHVSIRTYICITVYPGQWVLVYTYYNEPIGWCLQSMYMYCTPTTIQYTCIVLIGYYPPTREVSYLLRETRGREAPEGESSKYDTSRGRRVVTHLSPNKRSKIHGENRCIFLKIFSVLQSSPVCLRYSESAIYGKKHPKM